MKKKDAWCLDIHPLLFTAAYADFHIFTARKGEVEKRQRGVYPID